jgi:hypothetical protein
MAVATKKAKKTKPQYPQHIPLSSGNFVELMKKFTTGEYREVFAPDEEMFAISPDRCPHCRSDYLPDRVVVTHTRCTEYDGQGREHRMCIYRCVICGGHFRGCEIWEIF